MTKKLYILIALLIVAPFSVSAQGDLTEYKTFAEETGKEIIAILKDESKSFTNRKEDFRKVLQTRFSLPSIARFVLARYWRRATDAQKERYLDLFEEATVTNYAAQFDNYNNETIDILSVRSGKKNSVIVSTQINRPSGGEPLKVDWYMAKSKKTGEIKIVNLYVNGVSMSITQRSEYNAMVQSAKGDLDRFLDTLEAQTKS